MVFDLTTRPIWRIDDDDDWGLTASVPSGLSISEDEKNVYIEAAVPGIDPKDIEVTFDKGVVWIKGESKQEEGSKKFYRKAANSFSYRVAVPGDIDTMKDPLAVVKNGVMKVTFTKSPMAQPRKISVKEEK